MLTVTLLPLLHNLLSGYRIDFPPNWWSWQISVIIGLVIIIFIILESAYRQVPKLKSNIIWGETFTDQRTWYIENKSMTIAATGTPSDACHVKVLNSPSIRKADAEATGVWAKVKYFCGNNEIVVVYGRWGSERQPASISRYNSLSELYSISLPATGIPKELDIALKYKEDEDCYAVANESFRESTDGRVERFRLNGSEFRVEVILRGNNMKDKDGIFLLRNLGKGKSIELTSIKL